jgi:hypothetical protein
MALFFTLASCKVGHFTQIARKPSLIDAVDGLAYTFFSDFAG